MQGLYKAYRYTSTLLMGLKSSQLMWDVGRGTRADHISLNQSQVSSFQYVGGSTRCGGLAYHYRTCAIHFNESTLWKVSFKSNFIAFAS